MRVHAMEKAVCVLVARGHHVEVFLEMVIVIARDIARDRVHVVLLAMAEHVPIGHALVALVPRALALVRGGRAAPHEIAQFALNSLYTSISSCAIRPNMIVVMRWSCPWNEHEAEWQLFASRLL